MEVNLSEEHITMKKMIIHGGQRLTGEVTIGGAKNSTVALIPAAILADTPVRFDMVPDILDVHNLMLILKSMNVHSTFEDGVLTIDPTEIVEAPLPSKAIKSLRASYYFMGSLLGRFQRWAFLVETILGHGRLINTSRRLRRWEQVLLNMMAQWRLPRVRKAYMARGSS